MCQTLAQGGKRCDTHKDGSKATVSLTSLITAVHEKIVRAVFGDLKKEGKDLESPEREEVVSYAETGKFLTKYNPDIPERKKKTLMRQFEQSKDESPSGALFHAWKHTLPETIRRSRKTFGAIGVAGVIMATSACGPAVDNNNPPPSPSVTISAEAKSTVAGTVVNGIPTKGELANDGKGNYVQTTISSDDPANSWDSMKTTTKAHGLFTYDEFADGQRFAAKFVAEEVLDSEINDNPGNKEVIDRWVSKNGDKIDPAMRQAFVDSLSAPVANKEDFLVRGTYRQGKYDLVSGENQTRIASRTITPTAVRGDTINGKNYVEYEFDVNTTYNVKIDGRDAKEGITGKIQIIMGKNTTTNQWEIAGANNTFQVTQPQ